MTNLTLSPLTGITHGSPVTVSITVAPPPGGTGTPTGDVTLLANASATSTGGQSVDKFVLAGGTVGTITHLLPGGTNTMSAYYAGDTTFVPSASAATQVTVSAEPSSATVKALTADSTGQPVPFASGPYGSFVYLRADVAGKSGFGTPTGGVSFFDNTGFLTSQNLNSQGNTNTPNGIFTLAPGPHAITATYLGDVSFLPSNPSPPVNFSITKAATTTTVQASPSPVASGSPTTLTAVVDTTSGGNAPSGTVLFFNGGTQLPGNSFLSSGVNSKTGFAQSTATYQATTLPNGQDSITAQYTDDPNYTGSTSPAIPVSVAPDFALAFTGATGNTMTIAAPGGSGGLTLTVTGQTGYNGTVSFSGAACLGLPLGASCSFSPASVTGSGMTTLTVRTIASHSRLAPGGTTILNAWAATGGLTLAGVFLLGFTPRKRRWASLFGLLMLAGLMTIAGCGGSGGGGGGGTIGTIPGSYPVTVTGADANFSHPVSFTLNVQ